MAHTNLELNNFLFTCINLPITVEFLKTYQTTYNFIENEVFYWIFRNSHTTATIFKWLFEEYPIDIIQCKSNGYIHSPLMLGFAFIKLTNDIFTLIIDHLISHESLYLSVYKLEHFIYKIFSNRTFDGSMLNYLYQRVPQLNIMHEDDLEKSPLFYAIVESPRLLELLHVIKSNEPTHTRIQIRTKYSNIFTLSELTIVINRHAENSDKSTICALVGLCGELFKLISKQTFGKKYLTQEICNQFYSSKYFHGSHVAFGECDPDQESLIELIPEQFRTNLLNVNLQGRKTKPALRVQLEPE
jgi:hypothetical protein